MQCDKIIFDALQGQGIQQVQKEMTSYTFILCRLHLLLSLAICQLVCQFVGQLRINRSVFGLGARGLLST